MSSDHTMQLPEDAPDEVKDRAGRPPRVPAFDPTLGVPVPVPPGDPVPNNRLVAIGDSLTHGFQSGAVYNTDLSYPAIIAYELGWLDRYRYPRYGGPGGIPLNLELLLRHLAERFGPTLSWWELPMAVFAAREFLDRVEDYWERGAGSRPPATEAFVHDLSVYGWDLRDALSRTYADCSSRIGAPKDDLLTQIVESNNFRAALRVYPGARNEDLTVFDIARRLGEDHDDQTDCGIETLVVFLGSNNALRAVTGLKVAWSGPGFDDLDANSGYTVWRPEHFAQEFRLVADLVRGIGARHVIWCTVPHVTIIPIARGIGRKRAVGSAYFPYYTRPWIRDEEFDPSRHPCITGDQAHAVDVAIDMYDDVIEDVVREARQDGRNWYLLDLCGLLDRLASRRYITDPNARPDWWTPYPLPPLLSVLDPPPDSRFLTSDGKGGRGSGGLFSLDGVHPTTVGYGLIAQELINIMRLAQVQFFGADAALRTDPVTVDFARLLRRDTLVTHPPQNISSTLDVIAWADETVGWIKHALAR
jgi:hypothetical protein